MDLNVSGFDLKKAVESVLLLVEKVTCSECCCMYVIPTGTAECGHCLCKTCWLGRTYCPECNTKIDKSKLKFNETLAEMQKYVDKFTQNFENVFGIDVNEFSLMIEDSKKTTNKPTNRVEDWLKNSQNKFSTMLSQDSTQDVLESAVKVVSKVQVHESKKEKIEPITKKVIPNPPQDDWDKIEIVPDTDNENDIRENILGPMDLETFEIEDEYTSKKPRRSLRNNNNTKNSSAETSTDTDKKADKSKQNWTEVKKMKKEFSKLAKSKPKLNVSIEKCKRSNSKQASIAQFSVSKESQEQIVIDDNTPNIAANINTKSTAKVKPNMEEIVPGSKENDLIQTRNSKLKEKYVTENENEKDLSNNSDKVPVTFVKKSNLSHKNLNKIDSMSPKHIDKNISNTANVNHPKVTSNIETNNDDNSLRNSISFSDDSVHITIKFRGLETYINIKTDDSTNDQGVQTNPVTVMHKGIGVTSTTVSPETKTAQESCPQKDKSKSTPTIEKTMCSIGVQTSDSQLKCTNDRIQSHESKDKLSKKNTDSADTATANYEITETIAKELSVIMECDENDKLADTKIERSKTRSSQKPKSQPKSQHKEPDTLQGVDMDDIDIFNSGSLKEKPVHKLKDTIDTQSEILMTHKSTRSRTRNIGDKRQRDTSDEDKSRTKRQKKTQEIQNTSGTNYDEILGHIFTNIDDEIQKSNEKVDKTNDQKYSENIFSLAEKESQAINVPEKAKTVAPEMSQEDIDNLLTPGMCEDLAQEAQLQPSSDKVQPVEVVCTPVIASDEDDHSVVEDTPQKSTSFTKPKSRDSKSSGGRKRPQVDRADSDSVAIVSLDSRKDSRQTLDSPMTITRFVDQIQHNSTPVARKTLDFHKHSDNDDDNVTLCPSLNVAKTTQEKALMSEAFEIESQVRKPLSPINIPVSKQYCIAGSCLKPDEMMQLKLLCHKRRWIFADKYSAAVTHLIVGVDEENRSQRSVKYMCALAAGCWILSPQWLEKCLKTNTIVGEEPYEVLDSNGEPGPRRSRLADTKIFSGFSFHCLPPFNVLDPDTLKCILEMSGGRVVNEIKALKDSHTPAFVLAEPENTEDLKYMYMAMDHHIVPVNFEWVLNCLGSYTLLPATSLLLCPNTMLPKTIRHWPEDLFVEDDQYDQTIGK